LYLAFQADDSSHYLYSVTSSDGVNFSPAYQVSSQVIGLGPSLAIYNVNSTNGGSPNYQLFDAFRGSSACVCSNVFIGNAAIQ
jgi:hypothetical protein